MQQWLNEVLRLVDPISKYSKLSDTSYVIPLFNMPEAKANTIKNILLNHCSLNDIVYPFKSIWCYSTSYKDDKNKTIISFDQIEDTLKSTNVLFGFKKDGITITFFVGVDNAHYFSSFESYRKCFNTNVDLIEFIFNFEKEYLDIPENKLTFLEEYIMQCRKKL